MDILAAILVGSFIGTAIILPLQIALYRWDRKRYLKEKYEKYPWLNPNRTDLDTK